MSHMLHMIYGWCDLQQRSKVITKIILVGLRDCKSEKFTVTGWIAKNHSKIVDVKPK